MDFSRIMGSTCGMPSLHGHVLCLMPVKEKFEHRYLRNFVVIAFIKVKQAGIYMSSVDQQLQCDTVLSLCLVQLRHSAGSLASLFPHAAADYGSSKAFACSQSIQVQGLQHVLSRDLPSMLSSALGELSYMRNDCRHTELKFIPLSMVVSWSDIILLLITKRHTLQIH